MNNRFVHGLWIVFLFGFLISCGNSNVKEVSAAEEKKKDSVLVESADKPVIPSKYAALLEKFKPISFDTLKVYYKYTGKRFDGKELTLKEAKIFPIGITENYFGKLSGVYACYQFQIDSTTLGLIARTPSEYESSSIKLFLFDTKKDVLLKEYFELSQDIGDAGDYYNRTSWLFKTKNSQIQSFVYDYSSYYHGVEDTTDETVDEWHSYFLIDCMSPKFDTISKNETQLKKRFKRVLKKENRSF